jgi:membrane protein YdbS with pleckstrin-like domain
MESLNPRVRWLWVGGAAVGAVVLGAIAAVVVTVAVGRSPLLGGAVAVIVFALGATHALLRYRAFGYEVQDEALYIERGVLTQVRTVVPYVRVQHVDTQRSPLERILGLGSVVVYTAGSRGADVTVPGLEPDRASGLQQRLRRLAGESESDDAV